MPRDDAAKSALRRKAEDLVASNEDVRLDNDETTGDNNFPFRKFPDVRGVVIDCGSDVGYVQISGGDTEPVKIYTGPNVGGYQYRDVLEKQSCMLYGCPTVWYIVPRY